MNAAFFHALIRTHHITSRKKIATLRDATKKLSCHAILRSGGVPGVMFVEGKDKANVQRWVEVVHGLRYKDYQLVSPVVSNPAGSLTIPSFSIGVLEEVHSVKEFAVAMKKRQLLEWWRNSMGYVKS